MKTSSEIRQDFLVFFAEKEHRIVPSAPVIPYNDPTLLFTNAGMNQFKDVLLGSGTRDYKRCADTQKCIRVSGKHNDLEEVGHDGYHHTFFEMLGNWSFGDYYKKDAIKWAWELLTEKWNLPKERIWATVFRDDDESYNFWKFETDINPEHILRFDEKDNFWEMGDTGPCGPCSEIHIDLSSDGCSAKDINSNNPDVIEIWNLVFIQYNRDTSGNLQELPKKNIDTGMGFERVVRVLQNKKSNYETDIFLPLINELINITGKEYSGRYIVPMNVISDHIRALAFAIGDGAIPSNEGRGYVLRRILRRAARFGRTLDMHKPFIYKLIDPLVKTMGNIFPEIESKKDFIKDVIQGEEESFNETLDRGLTLFNEEIGRMHSNESKIFSGESAFKLHDTYGFPIDLTQMMAREKGYEVDINNFEKLMEEQKERARDARNRTDNIIIPDLKDFEQKKGYYNPYTIDDEGLEINVLNHLPLQNSELELLIVDKNPFYIESGGQVSDKGKIVDQDGNEFLVEKPFNDTYIYVKGRKGINLTSKKVKAYIDFQRRLSIQRNHSATHLVHEALRRVLGPHIKQMGSYLDDKFLRFDFPHFHKLTSEELRAIEALVNEKITEKIKVNWEFMPMSSADKISNLRKLFGEKYGDEVRVVTIDDKFSVELCGGTHVTDTSNIGFFKIIKEESVASGIRRIFAVTGEGVLDYLNERTSQIENILNQVPKERLKEHLKSIEQLMNLPGSIKGFKTHSEIAKIITDQDSSLILLNELHEKYIEEKKQAEKKLSRGKVKQAIESLDDFIAKADSVNNIKVVAAKFETDKMDELKEIGDALRSKLRSGAGLLYSVNDGKINLVAVITDDLISGKGMNAGKLAGEIAKMLGGGGGGRPHLATAGGKDVSKLESAVTEFKNVVRKYLNI